MTNTRFISLTAGLFALIFFSCSSNGETSSAEEVSSSSLGESSSSREALSSSETSSSSSAVPSSGSEVSSSSETSSSSSAAPSSGSEVSSSSEISSSSSAAPSSSSSVALSSSTAPSSSSYSDDGSCAGFVYGATRLHYGKDKPQFCDERDGKKYVYVTMGTQIWMAENLNYNATGSKCYGNSEAYCDKYGKLYTWATAMDIPSNCNYTTCESEIQSKHQGFCPIGWHIPSHADWDALYSFAQENISSCGDYTGNYLGGYCSVAGKHLKEESDWERALNIIATDKYGFSALPGGTGEANGASGGNAGMFGSWWSSREVSEYGAAFRRMYYDDDVADWTNTGKSNLHSVRCVKD